VRVPRGAFGGLIDGVHIYGRVLHEEEIAALALGESVDAIARKPAPERSEIERDTLRSYFFENAAPQEIREAWGKLTTLRLEEEKLERTFPTVMVMAESPVRKQTHLLIRGAYDQPGQTVSPGFPLPCPRCPPARRTTVWASRDGSSARTIRCSRASPRTASGKCISAPAL
jgi:hypothetical protein